MDNVKLFDLMKKNGLSERESKVYYALLTKPNATPTQIHNIAGIIRNKIYEVLSSLVSKGLIAEELVGKKKVYRALNPENAFSSFVQKKENELILFKKNNDKLVTLATEMYNKTETDSSPFYQLEHLSDPVSIKERYRYYLKKAKHEILVFAKPPYINLEEGTNLKNDVHVKTIMEYRSDKEMKELLQNMENDPRDDFRFIDELPVKLTIIDCKITILALESKNTKIGNLNTIFLNEPIIALFMKEIFESRWKKALSLEKYRENFKY